MLLKLIICDNEDFKNGVVITGAFGSAALLGNSNKKYGIHSHSHFWFHLSKIETSELLPISSTLVLQFMPILLFPFPHIFYILN